MKTSTKFLIVAACMVVIGAVLIVVGGTVLADKDFAGVGMPHLGTFIPGIFIVFLSIPLWFMGLIPRIAKASARLQNETLDNAGEDIGSALQKTANISAPAINTITTTVAQSIKTANEQTIFCKHCGKTISTDSVFCKYCGKKQN